MVVNVRSHSFYLFALCVPWCLICVCDTRSLASPLNTSISHSVLVDGSPSNGGEVNHQLAINPWFGNGLLSSIIRSPRQSDANYVGNSFSSSIDDRPVWGESNLSSNNVTSQELGVTGKPNNSSIYSNKRETSLSDIQSDDGPVWGSNSQSSNKLIHQEPTVKENLETFSDERETLTSDSELDDRPVWGENLPKVDEFTTGPEEDIFQGVSYEYSGSTEADVVISIDFVSPRTFPKNESGFVENKASANIRIEANPQGEAHLDEHGMLKIIPTSLTKVVVTKSSRYCFSHCMYPYNVPYVHGGINAGLHEFPHMTALGYGSEEVRGRFPVWSNCGGTLISKNYVLTAAHCTDSSWGHPTVVRVGEHDLSRKDEGAHAVDHPIKRIIVHPDYRSGVTLYNDIALLELTTPVNFTQHVRPACLFNHSEGMIGLQTGTNKLASQKGQRFGKSRLIIIGK
uniref:Serine protease snake n=1 Tax=Cacopsylla melanoneura TaxID=428564 RepID=A0A8D9E4D6_9HEMI